MQQLWYCVAHPLTGRYAKGKGQKMDLERILDSGWNPTEAERVSKALEYIQRFTRSEAISMIDNLIVKFRERLEFQTKRISGSGCQQDVIDAYCMAYDSAVMLKDKYTAGFSDA
ncbi:TPA: hypothetical protein ACGVAU_004693 [Vibrio vulnificus]|uniref:hypothetical protein n=1 Tax=Vibrio vulnificus TaxID=672 RepID=UPI000F4D5055|nr:hypothetical protein [Vibrio vulnificus]EID4426185.1 hypothetical protein [Vibrio vulnificus]ELE1962742.1 hypothetical protein [Vibrio vulnificus]ELL0598705.1 hypothetical protein [Vibrio vulnificus]ELV8702169.1 hypothetical protein [Vibrio vulnificus]ELV8813286.1 hypothetical protein [Vibrio vulnificus]